jgi:hypothetical protein
MIFYRSVISIIAIMFCSFCAVAQENNYVYQDTAILQQDSIEAATRAIELARENEDTVDEDESDDYVADTVLQYNQLALNPDSIRNLKNSESFAYAKNLDSLLLAHQQALDKEEDQPKNRSLLERFFLSSLTKYFFWLLAAVFVAFVLYKLFFTEGFFQRSYAKSNVTTLEDESNELSKTADYAKLVALAVSNGNYRLAVRYHYLQTLQKLALKGLIQFAADKTNYEYVRELSGKSYKNDFASLTLNYEYVWYGAFGVDEMIFNSIQNKFKQFNNEV